MADNLLPGRYAVGAASVDAGGTIVTPTGASWTDNVWGDDLFFLPSQPLVPPQRVESVNEDGELVLAYPWPGAAAAEETYEVRFVGIIERSTAQSRRVLEQLGDVKAWYDIIVADDASRLALESPGSPLRAGYRVLVKDDGVIWAKETAAYGDWIGPVAFKGDMGAKGWSPVHGVVADGARRVWRLVDWVGGEGTPPDGVGKYVGAEGLVDDIGDATDVRGPAGMNGTGTGDMVGPVDSANDEIVVFSGATGKLTKRGGKTIAEIASTGSVPLGTPMPVITNVLPGGYLWLEGGTYDPLVYPAFAAYMVSGGYVSGQLPDWRNRVPRGLGGLTGAIGSLQEDAFQGHRHFAAPSNNNFLWLTSAGGPYLDNSGGGSRNLESVNQTGNAALPDGVNGTPRTATETRVKAFIVRWAIKAYGAINDAGSANLVAIEQAIANGMIRKDADQNAQALSAALKVNILKNILQGWETIGGQRIFSAATELVWTGLADFADIRLELWATPSIENQIVGMVSVDNGANWLQNIYSMRQFFAASTSISAQDTATNQQFLLFSGPTAVNIVDIDMKITRFNKAMAQRISVEGKYLAQTTNVDSHIFRTGYMGNTAAKNALRIAPTTGAMTGQATLWGRRG